jgi:acyl carrier protein
VKTSKGVRLYEAKKIQADALDLAELMSELREEFGVVIPEDDALEIDTVGDVIHYLARHPREGPPTGHGT